MTKKADFLVIASNSGVNDRLDFELTDDTELTDIYRQENRFCFAVIGLNGNKASEYLKR